jgi:4-hydroxybenzoate polyprenyltransferase
MTLTTLSTLAGLAAALSLAAWLGGAEGTGVLTGYLAGAAVTGACFVRQRRILRERPDRALRSMIEGFLAKLLAVVALVLGFVVFPALREIADHRLFLLAFTAAMLILLFTGTFDNAQLLRERRAE